MHKNHSSWAETQSILLDNKLAQILGFDTAEMLNQYQTYSFDILDQ